MYRLLVVQMALNGACSESPNPQAPDSMRFLDAGRYGRATVSAETVVVEC